MAKRRAWESPYPSLSSSPPRLLHAKLAPVPTHLTKKPPTSREIRRMRFMIRLALPAVRHPAGAGVGCGSTD